MNKIIIALLVTIFSATQLKAQTTPAPGPAERNLMDSLCTALGKLDLSKLSTKEEANAAFMDCFLSFSPMLIDVAKEKNVDITDNDSMHQLGLTIGANMMKQKCVPFMKIAGLMAGSGNKTDATGTTQGTVKRVDNKGFNYIIVTDANGNEKSFLWLRQFAGSEKFAGLPATYVNKKVRIKWQNMEVYLPQAKGYYNVKEITALELL